MKLKAVIYVKRKKMWAGETAELDPPFHRDDAIIKKRACNSLLHVYIVIQSYCSSHL